MNRVLDGPTGEIVHLKGKTISGGRDCSNWPDDLYGLYKQYTDMPNLFKGTLNIELDEEYGLESPDKTFPWRNKSIFLKECKISFKGKAADAFIIRNNVDKTHPKKIIELISGIHFRADWHLTDGDEVDISVTEGSVI